MKLFNGCVMLSQIGLTQIIALRPTARKLYGNSTKR